VVHHPEPLTTLRRRIAPCEEALDHASTHRRGERETPGLAAALPGGPHIEFVGLGDHRERGVVGETTGEHVEEAGDLLVVDLGQVRERRDRSADRRTDQLVFGCRDVQQVAGLVHDDQMIAGSEGCGQFGSDDRAAIASHRDAVASGQPLETGKTGCVVTKVVCHGHSVGPGATPSLHP